MSNLKMKSNDEFSWRSGETGEIVEVSVRDGWMFSKLGRMTGQEFMDIAPVAMNLLNKHGMGV